MSCCAAPAHAAWQSFRASAGGLSDDNIFSISESPTGAIWLGTGAPAASGFDGVRWRTVTDSLPPGKVRAVLEDHAGRQWFGTDVGGLAMFDGRRWARFGQASGELPADAVTAMLEDRSGDLWVGTSAGLARREHATGAWTTYRAGAGQLVDPTVTRLFEDSRGRLWVATTHGASALDASRTTWTSYSKGNSGLAQDTVTAVCEDVNGRTWFGTNAGVFVLDAGAWSHVATIAGLPNDLVLAAARDSSGRMWLAGSDGVVCTDGRAFRPERLTSDGVAIGPIASLLVDSSGNLWLGGTSNTIFYGWVSHGLFRFDGSGWRNFFASGATNCTAGSATSIPSLDVLGSNCLETAFADGEGSLWFSGHGEGLSRLDANGAWSVLHRSALAVVSDSVICVAEDHAATLWFGSSNAGVSALDPTRTTWQAFGTAEGLVSNDVRTLFVDSRGDLWAGTGSGASRRSGGTWSSYLGGGFTEVQHVTEDGSGRVWLQTSAGLYSVDTPGAAARPWTSADGLPDDLVTAMLATPDGAMWFGTARGLARLAPGGWTTWKDLGAPGDSSIQVVRADRAGGVWAGTDIDASRWDGVQWTAFRFPQQLAGLPVTDIFADSSGTVWVHTMSGTSRFSGRAWKKVSGPGSGMTNEATNASVEDGQLGLWFASYSGLAEYQPDRVAPQTVFVNTPPALSASRTAGFVYAAAYGEVADLEYSTAWDGGPYSPWNPDNTLNLAGIDDGVHTLRVRARDWVGNVDPTPAEYTFEVDATPPTAVFASPLFGQPVRGVVAIRGTAADPRFHDLLVQARPAGTPTWSDPAVRTLARSTVPVTADTLAVWDTGVLPDGGWELRLAVTDTLGLVANPTIQVIVDNVAPFANVTSPVRLVAHDGGDVYTTNGEVHAYFPPHAFDADPLVSVDSTGTAAPDTLAGGARRVSTAWGIAWTGASMARPGTLEMRPSGGGGLAIWREDGGGNWTRLGGTTQPNGALAITLSSAGRYAIYAESTAPSAQGGLSGLALTPRAFSPAGHYASRELSIGFSLARPGPVTVKLYNRAGRIVRVVARDAGGEAGANLLRWDGRDDDGHVVEPGLYLVTVEALGETHTGTLAVVH